MKVPIGPIRPSRPETRSTLIVSRIEPDPGIEGGMGEVESYPQDERQRSHHHKRPDDQRSVLSSHRVKDQDSHARWPEHLLGDAPEARARTDTAEHGLENDQSCLLYTSPSPRD